MQLEELGLGSSSVNAGLWKLNYDYGELNTDGTVNTAKNTGNIAKQASVPGFVERRSGISESMTARTLLGGLSMIVVNIASLNLHDSGVNSITVRTTDEGEENISLGLDYLTDYESFETVPKDLVFVRCWAAEIKANFRYSGPDLIFSAEELTDSHLIRQTREAFAKVNILPTSMLRHFIIVTGLTASRLEVVAEELRLVDALPEITPAARATE
ncbi:MAG: hypothetical protein AB7F88_00820 [Pyrinomonadaceae bacterium]